MDEHGKPTTAAKQKACGMEADRIKGHLDKKRRMPTLQRRPNTQQRQQSRQKEKTEKHQHCQLELGRPENQGCIRVRDSYTGENAMEHHLISRILSQNRQTGLWRKRCLFQRPNDAWSVACTGNCPEKRGKSNESNRWRIQIDSHRGHHQQHTTDHRISTSSTQVTSAQAFHSNTRRVRHDVGEVSKARSADGHGREFEACRPLRRRQNGICGPAQRYDGRRRGKRDLLRELHGQERAGSAKFMDPSTSITRRNAHKKRVGRTRDNGQSFSRSEFRWTIIRHQRQSNPNVAEPWKTHS